MRKILFKAKRIDYEKLPKKYWWEYGVPIKHSDGSYQMLSGYSDARCLITIIPETICEFTGLYDNTKWEELSKEEQNIFLSKWNYEKDRKNIKYDWIAKPIFERDIINISYKNLDDSICEIKFINGKFVGINMEDDMEENITFRNCNKVIGNIFDDINEINKILLTRRNKYEQK